MYAHTNYFDKLFDKWFQPIFYFFKKNNLTPSKDKYRENVKRGLVWHILKEILIFKFMKYQAQDGIKKSHLTSKISYYF